MRTATFELLLIAAVGFLCVPVHVPGGESDTGLKRKSLYDEQTIVISGKVELQEYSPESGKPYTNQHARSTFVVTLSGNAFKCSLTNSQWPRWYVDFVYDGTNSYTILPFEKALQAPFGGFGNTNPSSSGFQIVTIEPSDFFIQRVLENHGLYAVWLTYGLSPKNLRTNELGLVDRPLSAARKNPGGFGYAWFVDPSPDERFTAMCQVVRDKSLDLPGPEELFRQQLDYPETGAELKEYKSSLYDRKKTPDGYVKLRYNCTNWWRTKGLILPAASQTEISLEPWVDDFPFRIVIVTATDVAARPGKQSLLPPITISTHVQDYRYKRIGESRVFKFADYWLKPGESWKPGNDRPLLRDAEEWLRNGLEVQR